jgi:hypothetical protein
MKVGIYNKKGKVEKNKYPKVITIHCFYSFPIEKMIEYIIDRKQLY